jgi:hypothetical protein
MVLVPLAYIIFVSRLILSSIGVQTLWMSFVVFSVVIAAISLFFRRNEPVEADTDTHIYPSSLQNWMESIHKFNRSPYFKWHLAKDLGQLMIESIAHKRGISVDQTFERLNNREIELPEEIINYVIFSQKPYAQISVSSSKHKIWLSRIRKISYKNSMQEDVSSPLDLKPEYLVSYLETYLNMEEFSNHVSG